jgi:hypothetical protein
VSAVHEVIGFAVVALFAVGWTWGLVARFLRRGPGDLFWRWLTVAQVVAGLQALLGAAMLVLGHRVVSPGILGGIRHYVYGLLPLMMFVFAHVIARAGNAGMLGFDPRKPIAPWVPFAWASFVSFGLALQALRTGLGQ